MPLLTVICTERLERPQLGAEDTTGVIVQLRFIVPVNDPVGAKARLKMAVCPALMICEVDEPDAGPTVKSGVAVPNPDNVMICGLPSALSARLTVPARLPVVVGVNVMET